MLKDKKIMDTTNRDCAPFMNLAWFERICWVFIVVRGRIRLKDKSLLFQSKKLFCYVSC